MKDLPHSIKVITVWLVVGMVIFLGIQAWQHQASQTRFQVDGGVIEIQRSPDGHYHWPGSINGRAVDFLIDTGATGTAMSAAMARELGLTVVGTVQSMTAGGVVPGTVVLGDVVLQGGVQADRLRITALQGLGERPLLGMDVLGKLRWTQAQGVLRIDTGSGR